MKPLFSMKTLRHVVAGAALFAALPLSAMAQNSLATGRALYRADCSGCHLASGAGGVRFAHSVSANLRAPGLERTYKHSTALLVRAILAAKDETGERLDPPMPAWRGRLSEQQALDIVAYLKTLRS
jgi:mono/diheme cytochrome c family protein